jgi:hypothetical protein
MVQAFGPHSDGPSYLWHISCIPPAAVCMWLAYRWRTTPRRTATTRSWAQAGARRGGCRAGRRSSCRAPHPAGRSPSRCRGGWMAASSPGRTSLPPGSLSKP